MRCFQPVFRSMAFPLAAFPLAALALVACVGCEQVKLPPAVNQQIQNAQQQMNQGVDEARQAFAAQPGVELTTTPAIKNGTCHAEFMPPREGRPGVLTFATYKTADDETYPTVYAQARVPALVTRELLGKTIAADVYVRRDAQGPVLRSPRNEPVQLRIATIEGGLVVAEVVSGSLVNVETNDAVPFLGKLTGRMP